MLVISLQLTRQYITKVTLSLLSLLGVTNIFNLAEARTIASGMYFQGDYKNEHIYGSLNTWDNRVCTVINNKVAFGQVSDDLKTLTISGRKVKNMGVMLFNPAGSSQIPTALRDSEKFQKCVQKTMYAKCSVKAGTKYYKADDTDFRGVIKTQKAVFSMGVENNSYDRGEKVENWAWLSFNPSSNESFIIDKDKLNCKIK